MINHLVSRGLSAVSKALYQHINAYKVERFAIEYILSDGEGAIAALSDRLRLDGINFNPAGPGEHVPVVERKIRQVKERVRSHVHALPFMHVICKSIYLAHIFCVLAN